MSKKNTVEIPEVEMSDTILILDVEKKEVKAMTGVDKDGNPETTGVLKKNQKYFINVDKQGDVFTNFFKNFSEQFKDPNKFKFFKMPKLISYDTAKALEEYAKNMEAAKGKEVAEKYEVKPEKAEKQEAKAEMAEKNGYRFKEDEIDWESMKDLGISKDGLEKMGYLDDMLKGYKTNGLVPVNVELEGKTMVMEARLSFKHKENGGSALNVHWRKNEAQLDYPFFGHNFSEEDKASLLKTGNLGRVVDLVNPKNGNIIPSIVSIDRYTNGLVALPASAMKIPDSYKGVELNAHQKQVLAEGKPLYLEGMISSKNNQFNSVIQYNADKKFIEILFNANKISLAKGEVPKNYRGRDFSEQELKTLNEKGTVYVKGLINLSGQPYNGYISHNKETGKTSFSFNNPDNANAQKNSNESKNIPPKTQKQENQENRRRGRKM